MLGEKRSVEKSAESSVAKRARTERVDAEEEDDLEVILAQIRQQEESEALARKLQDEWNTPSTSSSQVASGSGSDPEIIVLDEEEDDEAMAQRLARQWEDEDTPALSAAAIGTSPSGGPSRIPAVSVDKASPPDEQILQYRDLFTSTRKCSKCGADVESPRGYVTFSASSPPPSLMALLHACCSKCRTNHCRGCFTPIPCPPSCKGRLKNGECNVDQCCSAVRAIAIFEALGGFDRHYIGERTTSASRATAAAAKQKHSKGTSVGPGGTGYGTGGAASYGGYANSGRGGKCNMEPPPARDSIGESLAKHWEELCVRFITALTALLPAPYADFPAVYDILPHASIGHLLSLSQLPELLGSLLRNDSVTDWIARSETYYAMIGLLRRMADCELTIEVLIGQRWEKIRSCGLEEWMWGDDEIRWEMQKNDAGQQTRAMAPPLYEHFRKLTKQCEAFLAGATHVIEGGNGDDEETETTVKATSLCGDIIAARDDIERAMSVLGKTSTTGISAGPSSRTGKGKDRDTAIDVEKAYSMECERLAFEHVALGRVGKSGALEYTGYNYAQNLKQTENSTRTPKNRLHLVKELAVMATCLPPGVFVRVDEVRNDAIKIMIAGPEDTPYAGGLFEFDCFMPLEYPNTPPLMHLRTTGGGRVRFNPNLYANGKVCLSLLGTWPGRPEEQWSPKSTLLQVLVSIQSMILIDAPYYNEPGHGQANPKSAVSIAYNKNIALQTVRYGIVEWLKAEHKHGLWADVIASHFTIRKNLIRRRIQEWAAQDPRIQQYSVASTGTAGMAGTDPYHSHHHGRGKGKQTDGAQLQTTDLLAEYDLGIQRVQGWPVHTPN
ncbi:hypothetical protein PLICRDRAFT_695066 [Plicaturopsis crispa FD-325 SS-3]|nr:hypothetical protein PLICRDRAFT_695066 [Plicaturopsis crispa FD-325 SS-3]